MKKFNQDSKGYSVTLLLVGSIFLLFTGGKFNFWMAAWFPTIFFIRFFRTGKILSRYLITVIITWIVTLISWYGIQPLNFISYAITMLITTCFTVLPLVGDRLLYKKVPKFLSTLVFPIFATFLEYMFITGNPMGSFGSLAYSQFDNKFFIQLVSITGIMGLTFVINWFSSVVNHMWEKRSKKPVIVYFSILLAIYIFGVFSYFNESEAEKVKVAGIFKVHPQITLYSIMSSDDSNKYKLADELIELYIEETKVLAKDGYMMISWPEAAVISSDVDFNNKDIKFSKIADELNIHLIIPYIITNDNGPFENKLKMYSPTGATLLNHTKYGGNVFEGSLKGDGIIKFTDTEFGRISSVICWDMDFPGAVSQTGRNSVDILFSPANEWSQIIPVHAEMAVFRGIENGSSTIHPASMGLSLIADNKGRIISEENWYNSSSKSIKGTVYIKGTKTIYSVIGELFPIIIMILTLLLFIYSIVYKISTSKSKKVVQNEK
ncbi:MAG: hypothetical protein OCD02_17785 [Spirochaetaceae bacterium]